MRRTAIKLSPLLAAFAALLVLSAPAAAVSTSVTQRQVSPGVQQRVIWSQAQVAQYVVRVSHAGYLHAEITFTPTRNVCSVFIWDPADMRIKNIEQARHPVGESRAAVDFYVPDISAEGRTVIDPDGISDSGDERLRGDLFNVVVVCYGGRDTRFKLWGYAPQTDLHAGAGVDPTAAGNVYYSAFRRPTSGWRGLAGAGRGGPFDFTPTSEGEVRCDLTWPANVAQRRVLPDLAQGWAPAVWEQYLLSGTGWTVVMQDRLTSSAVWWPPEWGGDGVTWWGLSDTVPLGVTRLWAKPMRPFRYAPVLDLVTSDATRGPAAPLKTGVATMGFRATLTWPANLRFAATPGAIRKGARATLKGTFALNGAWVGGVPVTVQKRVVGVWKKVATVTTSLGGTWTLRVRPAATTVYRARAKGDDATGLATETSLGVRVKVR